MEISAHTLKQMVFQSALVLLKVAQNALDAGSRQSKSRFFLEDVAVFPMPPVYFNGSLF